MSLTDRKQPLRRAYADPVVVVCGAGDWTQDPVRYRQELYRRATPLVPALTSKHDLQWVLAQQWSSGLRKQDGIGVK